MNELQNESILTVRDQAGASHKVTVRQLRIGEFKTAIGFLREGDEPARLTMCTDMPLKFIESLTPEGYDALAMADIQVNRYFFGYASRQAEWAKLMRDGIGVFGSSNSAPSPA